MPDFRTVAANIGNGLLDSTALTQTIAGAVGYDTPAISAYRKEKARTDEMKNLALEAARAENERRPIQNRIQDENAAWAREQREQQKQLYPMQLEQEKIQTLTAKQRLAEAMQQAPLDRITKLEPVANDVILNQIMQNADDGSTLTPQDAAAIAQDPRFVKARNLYIVGDLANKAETGDEVAKAALDEQLVRMDMKLVDGPNGKFVHDNATGKDIPYDRSAYMEQWHETMRPAITEALGRKRFSDNLNSAGGRIANAFTNRLIADGNFKETDYGHAASVTWNAMTDGIKIDKNTTQEVKQRIGRELQAFDTLQTIGEGLKSTDPDEKRMIFGLLGKKTMPGQDGKYPLGGKLTVVPTADAADPGTADWRSVILSYTPEGSPPGTAPTIMQAPQMLEMLLAKNPVANRLQRLSLSLASAKALKEQDEIDKEVTIRERYAERMLLKEAKGKSISEMKEEALQMAEAQIPPGTAARPEAVKNRAGQIFIEMSTGKRVEQPKRVTAEDFLINAIGE